MFAFKKTHQTFIFILIINISIVNSSTINSLVQLMYKHPMCLYVIIDSADDFPEIFNQIEIPKMVQNPEDATIRKSEEDVCEHQHIKMILLRKQRDLRYFFEEKIKKAAFPAFSSIIIYGIVDEFEPLLRQSIERYALQIVSIKQPVNEESDSLQINWINKNQSFTNDSVFAENFTANKSSIHQNILYASAFNCFPFFMFDGKHYGGLEHFMLQEITKGYKLIYRVHNRSSVADTWEAVKIDVGRGITDIGMCSQWLSISLNTKTYSMPYTQNCATFLVPKPTVLSFALFVFLPFNYRVWICIVIVAIIQIIMIHFFARKYMQLFRNFASRYTRISDSFDHIVRILIQQSTNYFPANNQHVLRALILIWVLTSLLIATGYSAGITSLLAKPRYTKPINSFDDFHNEKIQWGSNNRLYADILLSSGDATMMKVANSYVYEGNDQVKSARLKRGKYAALIKTISNNFVTDVEFLQNDKELTYSLRVMQECLNNYYVVFSLRENSPFKHLFDKKIYQITESGLHKYWFNEIENHYSITYMHNFFIDFSDISINEALTLNKIQGIYVFYFCSIVLAIIVFVFEICFIKIFR